MKGSASVALYYVCVHSVLRLSVPLAVWHFVCVCCGERALLHAVKNEDYNSHDVVTTVE